MSLKVEDSQLSCSLFFVKEFEAGQLDLLEDVSLFLEAAKHLQGASTSPAALLETLE